jgi:urea transport system permease protein
LHETEELRHDHGLYQKVATADIVVAQMLTLEGICRDYDDGQVCRVARAYPSDDFPAIDSRQRNIQQQKVRRALGQQLEALFAISRIEQGATGGVNGITDLKTMLGWDIRTDGARHILYFVNALLLLGSIRVCRWIQTSKLGTLLLAMRDKEDRVRFSGYDVAMFRVFTFCLAALLSAIGGAMFALQVGFMSASFVGIVPSIEMVIFAAVGGRMSLVGAVYGTLLVNFGKTYFSESFPQLWLFLMSALFIGVVLAFPDGLAGVYESRVKPWLARRRSPRPSAAPAARPSGVKAPPGEEIPAAISGQRA